MIIKLPKLRPQLRKLTNRIDKYEKAREKRLTKWHRRFVLFLIFNDYYSFNNYIVLFGFVNRFGRVQTLDGRSYKLQGNA